MRLEPLRVGVVFVALASTPGCVEKHPDYQGAADDSGGSTGGAGATGSGTNGDGAGDGDGGTMGSGGSGSGTADTTTPGGTGGQTSGSGGTTTPGETVEEDVAVEADTHVDNAARDDNYGSSDRAAVCNDDRCRPMVRFDKQAMRDAAMNRPVVEATLAVHVVANDGNWGILRPIDLHRMLQDWGEGEATWSCAFDADPPNGAQDCMGNDAWDMDTFGPLSIDALDSVHVFDDTVDLWLRFDVTEEVQEILAGNRPNFGWLLKKENENVSGALEIATREHADPALHPKLTLELAE